MFSRNNHHQNSTAALFNNWNTQGTNSLKIDMKRSHGNHQQGSKTLKPSAYFKNSASEKILVVENEIYFCQMILVDDCHEFRQGLNCQW